MNYEQLVKALRCKSLSKKCDSCVYGYHLYPDSECNDACRVEQIYSDAADAIEALQARLGEAENSVERWKDMYLTKQMPQDEKDKILEYIRNAPIGPIEPVQIEQLPKRGEWVEENRRPRSSQFVCSECHRTAYDPQPTRDKAWRKRCRYAYCPNCGAKMEGGAGCRQMTIRTESAQQKPKRSTPAR